jgi:hypothetical protein
VCPGTPAFPARWFYGFLRALPGEGFVATVIRELLLASCGRSACIAASGPHDFAVRFICTRLLRNPRPPHPTARS